MIFLEIDNSSIPIVILYVAICNTIFYGFKICIGSAVRTFDFDKSNSRLTITNKNIMSKQVFQYALDEIIGLRAEQFRASNLI